MKLKKILKDEEVTIIGNDNIEISGVSYDSRKINKNYVFFSIKIKNDIDRIKYIKDAISSGASTIVTDTVYNIDNITQIIVKNISRFMSSFCAKFYNHPDKKLNVIGITGTNGKTTITYMLESIFTNSNINCGVIGTINYRYKNKIIESNNTTPQSLDIYKIMNDMINNDVKYIIIEVSSHALALDRVYGINFDMAIFTNLTQDHLDFHKNKSSYFKAKLILFKKLGIYFKKNIRKCAIINIDDTYGKKILKTKINAEIKSYSTIEDSNASFIAKNIIVTNKKSMFDLFFNKKKIKIKINQIGLHNIYNAIAGFVTALCVGIPTEKIVIGLNKLKYIPGRFEKIDTNEIGFDVIIDYAHTDDAIKNTLQVINNLKFKKIITIFGCGGNRDKKKRSLMGETVSKMSDFIFVTSDNPREEDPYQIILDIETGIKKTNKNNYNITINREIAIKNAIMMAEKGDVILIAGKGHENYQIIGTKKISFSDAEMAKKYIYMKQKQKTTLK
ncbi:MAG: UDP-N-acetylmuramoyl-L-alanyl-D-glutamate--2,6-diaminopimelate ligase [Endomicrobium sp.]|jgi:UDP-N-acetylmuramoyl-L-alanyl-D-glutamate--2,6-diaminopimelate ligase|nr:UDP-N-acetylmuramoyl-L-alanyl-D-glutamate--2,6-diaminopimelate ligase [Endomicrobium sp.]